LKELAQGASLEEVFLPYISKEPDAAAPVSDYSS
jgi:hypothetical protein